MNFMERFVPMAYADGHYEVRLRGGICIPRDDYEYSLRSTEAYVACFYPYRNYTFNRPTFFGIPERDADGREYILSWTGFFVWAEEPKKLYRVYHVSGDTVYLKYGSRYYRSVRGRMPVPDRRGATRQMQTWVK